MQGKTHEKVVPVARDRDGEVVYLKIGPDNQLMCCSFFDFQRKTG